MAIYICILLTICIVLQLTNQPTKRSTYIKRNVRVHTTMAPSLPPVPQNLCVCVSVNMCCIYITIDKVYEARHVLLNLSTPLVKPDIPATYFTPKEPVGEMAYRVRAQLLANYPESPLTPGIPANYDGNHSPFGHQSNKINGANILGASALTTAALNRFQIQQFQHQQQQQQQQQLHHHQYAGQHAMDMKMYQQMAAMRMSSSTMSPGRRSYSSNTSGINTSFGTNASSDQLYGPYQQQQQQQQQSHHNTPTHSSASSSYSQQHSPESGISTRSPGMYRRSNDCSGSSSNNGGQMFDNDSPHHYSPYESMVR